jgi:hypothetical protein
VSAVNAKYVTEGGDALAAVMIAQVDKVRGGR